MKEISLVAHELNTMLFGDAPLSREAVDAITQELLVLRGTVTTTDLARIMLGRANRFVNPSSWQVQFSRDDVVLHSIDDFTLALDRHDNSVSALIAHDSYEKHMLAFFRKHVKPGMVALDVGANVGLYTMQFSRLVGDSGKVISFEPNSENCRLLLLSAEHNDFKNIELLPIALSDRRGAHLFTTAIGTNGTFTDQRHDVMSRGCSVVPTLQLDSLDIGHVDVMKLDIEGAEYLALKGSERTIHKYRPIITTEFSIDMLRRISSVSGTEYFSWFFQRGYTPIHVPRDGSEPRQIEDVSDYLAGFGAYQIEDLAFFPNQGWAG
jgi:FkbM family methyltransferase